MSSVGKRIAIVVFAVGFAGAIIAPAASQARREKEAVEQKPDELWRLYPLDPVAGGNHQRPLTQTEASVGASPSPPIDSESEARSEVAPDDEESSNSSPLLIAITLGCMGALLVVLTVRRALRPVPPTQATIPRIRTNSEARPISERSPTQVMADLSAQQPPELSLVRVHLRDGRRMEGAVKHVATRDSPVLLLDVVDVSDAQGQKHVPEPFDAFVPLVEVERIEPIDDVDVRGPDATGRPQ